MLFIEYTRGGYPTEFTVTKIVPYKLWEFDMENSNIEGHWIGTFIEKVNETEVVFTEYVEVKKLFLELFAKAFLKKQLVQFVADLKKIWRYITYEENDRILWFGL